MSAQRSLSHNHTLESQQKLPSGNNPKMCICNPVNDDIFPSLDDMGIQEDCSEGDIAKYTDKDDCDDKLSLESSDSELQSEGEREMSACSGEFILYNPQLTIEVEIHPDDYEMKQLGMKDSGSCSYKGESFCGGDIDTPLYA